MPKNFKCEICDKAFESSRDLGRHKARKNPCVTFIEKQDLPEEKRGFTNLCKFCGRAFSCQASVTRHLKKSCKVVARDGDTSGMDKLFKYVMQKTEEQDKLIKKLQEVVSANEIRQETKMIPFTASTTIDAKGA